MSFAAVTLKVTGLTGTGDKVLVRTSIVAIEGSWTFEELLCHVLEQEGLPPRAEFSVDKVGIHDGDKISLAQPGSGWPKTVSPTAHTQDRMCA